MRSRSLLGRVPVAHASRRGAIPAWIPLALLFAGLLLGLQALQKDARQHGLARIDATRYRLHADTQWLSPAWIDELERLLVAVREVPIDDPDAIRALTGALRDLPFVAAVGPPEIQWPDGLSVPIKLHEPVACIRTGDRDFLPVATDGTVLGGYAYAPHEAYGGWLPTLGPHGLEESRRAADGRGALGPGDQLESPELLAALAVAESLWGHLDVEELRLLGRIVVDAASVDTPMIDPGTGQLSDKRLPGGVVLSLEEGRRVWFGRPPVPLHEGELPVGYKWEHVRSALRGIAVGEAWALLDVRFDQIGRWTRAEVERLEFRK